MRLNRASAILLLPLLAAVIFLRGYAFWGRDYPSGTDYGHHLFYAEQLLEQGALPTTLPYFHTGATNWSVLPGGALMYAFTAAFSGTPVIRTGAITLVFGVIETIGVYLLGLRLFRRRDSAWIAAAVIALNPAGAEMVAWSGYPNSIAIALIPFVFVSLLDYWHTPNPRTLLTAAIITCGMTSVHHLSTLWIGLTLGIFGAVHVLIQPIRSLKKLIPLAVVGVLIGLPILIKLVDVSTANRMTDVLLSGNRYDETRLNWSAWTETASAPMLVLATGGALMLFFHRGIGRSEKILFGGYALICLAFGFGWLYGLNFAYIRATFFIILLGALGLAALASGWTARIMRYGVVGLILAAIGIGTLIRAQPLTDYFVTLTPRVVEGARWLHDNSQPDEVVVVGTYFGYHMTRLLERPTLVAHSPDLVGNPDESPFTEAGFSILMGLQDMDAALERYNVKYIIVKANQPDIPDPLRSIAVLNAHPRMRLLFRNADMLIYGVEAP